MPTATDTSDHYKSRRALPEEKTTGGGGYGSGGQLLHRCGKLRVEGRLESFKASLFGFVGRGGSRSVLVLESGGFPGLLIQSS